MSFSMTIKTAEELAAEATAVARETVRAAIARHVEEVAQSRDYDSSATLASYVGSGNATWAAEAVAFINWRDAVWEAVYIAMAQVDAGTMDVPTPEEALALLPSISWPE